MNYKRTIRICDIREGKNARKDYSDMDELASSIRQLGLLQPIGLKEIGDGKYETIWGNRRFRICKSLGWETISAMIGDNLNEEVVQFHENAHRKNLSKWEESEAVWKIQQKLGCDHVVLKKYLGKDHYWVEKRLAYHEVKLQLIKDGIIPASEIEKLNFDICYSMWKHRDKKDLWSKMASRLIGKRLREGESLAICNAIVKNKEPAKVYRKSKPYKKRNLKEILPPEDYFPGKNENISIEAIGPFLIMPSLDRVTLRIQCHTEKTRESLIEILRKAGGEIS